MQRYLGKKNFPFIKLSSRIISDYQGKLLASIEAYEEIVAYARKKQAETGSKLLWGTANVFGHARYMNGAATNPDFDVVARAAVQIKNALDATIALGGENYVFWGGREGYMSLTSEGRKCATLIRSRYANGRMSLSHSGTETISLSPKHI